MEFQITVANSVLESSDISNIVLEIRRFNPSRIEGVIRILQAEFDGEVFLQFIGADGVCLPQRGKVVVLTARMIQKIESTAEALPTLRRFLQSIIAICEVERTRREVSSSLAEAYAPAVEAARTSNHCAKHEETPGATANSAS